MEYFSFPLIPLPIKEAVWDGHVTQLHDIRDMEFPLIPLPIKEAVPASGDPDAGDTIKFPLIPLPIKEAVKVQAAKVICTLGFH